MLFSPHFHKKLFRSRMKTSHESAHRVYSWISTNNIIFFFVLLFLQNIIIFWQHYFYNVGFPGDFSTTYFAWPAFWTTSISQGIFPQWIPYEAMGYPLAINAQSGLYYPAFWIFALLHIPFTLHAAVIVEVLHVLFGSFGMFLLLNLIFRSTRYAFVGAVAFQFFSGFYSLSQAADIVRAFAIAPWLFYVFKLDTDEPKITRRILFAPVVIYFMATGGYPGIIISSAFIIGTFLLLQIASMYIKNAAKLRSLKVGGAIIGLALLGISISIIHIGPVYQERSEITRFYATNLSTDGVINQKKLEVGSLSVAQFPLLYMSASSLTPFDQPWKSIFVSLPLLVFASFITISALKKHWIFVAILGVSLLMLPGLDSPFWRTITSVMPTLKLSLFPSSDYRVFVAIPLIILGIAGLKTVVERTLTQKKFILRSVFVIAWFSIGVLSLYTSLGFFRMPGQNCSNGIQCHSPQIFPTFQIIEAVIILLASLSLLYYFRKTNISLSKNVIGISTVGLVFLVLLLSADGFRYVGDMHTWKMSPADRSYVVFNIPLEKNGKLITYSIFENIPSERPARQTTTHVHNFSWKGYLRGDYMMNDYTSTKLIARSYAESNHAYKNYMFLEWKPLLLGANFSKSSGPTNITLPATFSNTLREVAEADACSKFICDSAFSSKNLVQPQPNPPPDKSLQNQVVQTRYGINDISYKVALKEPKLMVENEIYFPGWHADLIFPDKEMKIAASVVNGVFRAWLLPAGNYTMIAHFDFPNLTIYRSIAAIFFAVWIFIVIKYWRRLDNDHMSPIKGEEMAQNNDEVSSTH
jgi:hypothetical protein